MFLKLKKWWKNELELKRIKCWNSYNYGVDQICPLHRCFYRFYPNNIYSYFACERCKNLQEQETNKKVELHRLEREAIKKELSLK